MEGLPMVGLGLTAAVLAVCLRQLRPEIALALSLTAGALLLTAAVGWMGELLAQARELTDQLPLAGEHGQTMFKALGVCVITQLACDACKDAGEGAIAGKLELCGRTLVLMMSLPLLRELLTVITSLFAL